MRQSHVLVAVDVGVQRHRVAIRTPGKRLAGEFDVDHSPEGLAAFFRQVETYTDNGQLPVAVAMEGYNGHARPLDAQVLARGWRLFNVNNLKLARFKEIFPGPAKSDPIDTRKMLELFALREALPLAKDVLGEVAAVPEAHTRLKRLTRRRRVLVNEKVRVVNRMHSDLHAVCPGLTEITGAVDNLWFLRFLTCRDALPKLARLQKSSLLKIRGIGVKYAAIIQAWQHRAQFAPEVAYVGPMIVADARRILELIEQIEALEAACVQIAEGSELARRIDSIPGFGPIASAELAGEIGTLGRFPSEASLALYVGMACLSHQSGQLARARASRQVNRRAKAALMIALARHIEQVPESKAYYDRKRVEGKQHNQALRALGRHLIRVLWAMVQHQRNYEVRTPAQQPQTDPTHAHERSLAA
jgi:transposase